MGTMNHGERIELPQRKSHRLKNYDYSQNGAYFITVCTKNRWNGLAVVGNAVPGVPPLRTTALGKIVAAAWDRLSSIDPHVKTDCFCVMPNHVHGIIFIEEQPGDVSEAERRGRRSLQDLVRGFKSVTTREYNKMAACERKNALWQPSFYDKILRSEKMLEEIRAYILENPFKWQEDELYHL